MSVRHAPCPSCRRHVRADETVCPFCAAVLPADFVPPPRPVVRAVGPFTRSAVLFLGATACGGSVAPTEPMPLVFYGPAVVDDAGAEASARDATAADASTADAADAEPPGLVFYGPAPVFLDASEDQETDAPAAPDATPDATPHD
jgi:hypothetical protein